MSPRVREKLTFGQKTNAGTCHRGQWRARRQRSDHRQSHEGSEAEHQTAWKHTHTHTHTHGCVCSRTKSYVKKSEGNWAYCCTGKLSDGTVDYLIIPLSQRMVWACQACVLFGPSLQLPSHLSYSAEVKNLTGNFGAEILHCCPNFPSTKSCEPANGGTNSIASTT